MMKNVIFVLAFIALSNQAYCSQHDSTSIYFTCLSNHLDYLKSLKKNVGNLQQVYVEKNEITTALLPEEISGVRISYLTLSEIQAKTAKGQRIHLIVIRPVIVESESLKVSVIDFFVTSRKKNFNYANSGGSLFEFKYDCDKEKFLISNKRQAGI